MSTPDNFSREPSQPFVPQSPVAHTPLATENDAELASIPPAASPAVTVPPEAAFSAVDSPATGLSFEFALPAASPSSPLDSHPLIVPKGQETRTRQPYALLPKFAMETELVDTDSESETTSAPVIRSAPPWLFSLFIHLLLMVMAGLFFLPNLVNRQITLEIGEPVEDGEQLEESEFEIATSELEEIIDPVVSPQEVAIVEDPLASPPVLDIAPRAADRSVLEFTVPEVGSALEGREPGMKEALLAAYGGTPGTEAAVELALQWFKRNQHRNGFWSLTGPYRDGAAIENQVAASAMALLAFQGAGHTHLRGDYIDVVRKGWYALLGSQKPDGDFWRGGVEHQRLYAQAQATIALCEMYGMSRDEEYREPAQRAIDYAIKVQDAQGGWRYRPGSGSDTSVTGWFVMALQSARMAYLDVDTKALENVARYLDSAASLDGSRYGYLPRDGGTVSMTAEGLLCRQYLGWRRDDRRLASGVEYIGVHPIDFHDRNVYYWYYATQVIHHMDDDSWDRWNRVMRVELPKHQEVQSGREKGSWSPVGDRWGSHGGRLYTTALSTFMLEVYYRHLPIYANIDQFHGVLDDTSSP